MFTNTSQTLPDIRSGAVLNFTRPNKILQERKNQTLKNQLIICIGSDFIWPFSPPYKGVIPNPKMAFIFPISCIYALIFPIYLEKIPKCAGKGSFPKSQIKSLIGLEPFAPSLI